MDVVCDCWGITYVVSVCVTDVEGVCVTDVEGVGVTDVVGVGFTGVVIYVMSSHMSYLYVRYGMLSIYFAVNNLENVSNGVFHIS